MTKHDVVNELVSINRQLLKIKEININAGVDAELAIVIAMVSALSDRIGQDVAYMVGHKHKGG